MFRALLLLAAWATCSFAQESAATFGKIERLLRAHPDKFAPYLADPAAYRLQILYTEIQENGTEPPTWVRHGYRVDREYFYPASTVKLAAAAVACGTLRNLSTSEVPLDLDTALRIYPLFEDEEMEELDPSNLVGGRRTVGHAIRKICLVSDNRAYNDLYELIGHRPLNEALRAAGLTETHLFHRLSEFRSRHDQLRTPRIELLSPKGAVTVPERTSDLLLSNRGMPGILAGKAFQSGGQRIEEPFNFTFKNRMSLRDLQDMLVDIVRPDLARQGEGFDLTPDERAFLIQALGELPSESDNPRYDPAKYSDNWVKFFLEGARRVAPDVRIYNKVGRAYGFSIENAYLVEPTSGVRFFLSAVLYTNPNETLNDGVYGYSELADPFFDDLGEIFLRDAIARSSR